MSSPSIKKIALMASHDWTLRLAMRQFLDFIDPVIRWKGKEYKLELIRVIAKPLEVGTDLSLEADLVMDRTTHWNSYYRSWAHQAMNSMARMVNHSYTFAVFDKHSTYDLMSRAIHPEDVFPKTVLLPQFQPWTEDQINQMWWEREQVLIAENTQFGFDPLRRKTDMDAVKTALASEQRYHTREQIVRQHFYDSGEYLQKVVNDVFQNKYPLYLKKAYGGGGAKVYKINNFQELCEKYDRSGDQAYHLQEGIEPYDYFYRAMGVGPIVIPMIFQPDQPHHEHYSSEKPCLEKHVYNRLESYVMFINSYHRWTYNSFECLSKNGKLHPIDFANACPDSQFISLHVHFPLIVCSLLKWLSFCAVTGKDMGVDLQMTQYLKKLNSPQISQLEKFEFCREMSEKYYEIAKFNDFCGENFTDLNQQMVSFYDKQFEEIIRFAMQFSNFPEAEHETFYQYYDQMMKQIWRPNTDLYLTPHVIKG